MRRPATLTAIMLSALMLAAPGALAQDVRGLEVCTAEKQMDRRTGCLQANIDYLMQLIDKNAREARQKLDAAEEVSRPPRPPGAVRCRRQQTLHHRRSPRGQTRAREGSRARRRAQRRARYS